MADETSPYLPEAARYTGPDDVAQEQSLPRLYGPRTDVIWPSAQKVVAPPITYVGEPMSAPGMNEPAAAQAADAAQPASAPASAPTATDAQLQQLAATPLQLRQPQFGEQTIRERQVTEGLRLGDDVRRNLDNAFENARQAAELRLRADSEIAAEDARLLDDVANDQESLSSAFKLAQDDRNYAKQQELTKRQELHKQANTEVNPTRLWDEMSAGRKALALVAIMLGGLGRTNANAPNQALEMLNAAQAADIDAQKANIANARRGIEQSHTTYAEMTKLDLSEEEKHTLMRLRINENYTTKLKAAIARTQDPLIQARFQEVLSGLEAQRAQDQIKLTQLTQDHVVRATKTVPVAMGPDAKQQMEQRRLNSEIYNKYLQDAERKGSPTNAIREAKAARARFQQYMRAGATEIAMTDFIANTMKQGSYSPANFAQAVKKYDLFGAGKERLRRMINGGEDPELMRAIDKALELDYLAAVSKGRSYLQKMREEGVAPETVIGDDTEDESYNKAGAREVR